MVTSCSMIRRPTPSLLGRRTVHRGLCFGRPMASTTGIASEAAMRAYACPCCGFLTLEEPPPGTYEICPVCYWEDDPVQFDDPSYTGGANRVSLAQARQNFLDLGAAS